MLQYVTRKVKTHLSTCAEEGHIKKGISLSWLLSTAVATATENV